MKITTQIISYCRLNARADRIFRGTLKSFRFTNLADRATSTTGWEVFKGVVVNALAGNDTIAGTGDYYGIYSLGTINTDTGNDTITGTGRGSYYGIYNDGTIDTGAGNDTITGTSIGGFGIINNGIINTGIGNDTIAGTSARAYGIKNNGTIDTGAGNDTITGTGGYFGIVNLGTINTGAGNDTITGTGGYFGIVNNGTINTGTGNDTVYALKGGFLGDGKIYLGADNDELKGFGAGSFYGGAGIDKLFFGEGTYVISGSTVVSDGKTMKVFEFEEIGGANGGLFAFKNGTLTVDAAGAGTFA